MGNAKFIVKVQVSIGGNAGKRSLVYNEDRSVMWEEKASKDILELMDGEPKKYFWAWIDEKGKIIIDEEAPCQDW